MNDLTGAKVLKSERILFNAFKDMYFTSDEVRKIKYLIKRSKKLINFDICGFIGVIIVVHNQACSQTKMLEGARAPASFHPYQVHAILLLLPDYGKMLV
jgi:hypothetical protein